MIDKDTLLLTLPEGAAHLLTDERMISVRDGADVDKVHEATLALARAVWRWQHHTCPEPTGEWAFACKHLMDLWAARSAYQLAALAAPAEATGCTCDGSGVFYGRGYVENGTFRGTVGDCFRCHGKGYQTPVDVKRNDYYDRNVRRLPI